MEESDLKTITFKMSTEDTEAIDKAVRESGFSRSDYTRQRLLHFGPAPIENSGPKTYSQDSIVLLQEILYGLRRIHISLFGIGNLSRVNQGELERLSSDARDRSIRYIANLEERIGETRQQVRAAQGTK
jgi:hypothetical protein